MPRSIKLAAVQMLVQPAPTAERLARAEALINQAAGEGAQLVVLPEVFNTGYEYHDRNYELAEPLNGRTVTWMKQTAARLGIHLAGSLLLLDEEDIYNAIILFAPDGRMWRYNKNYPWAWERAYFRAGNHITIADTDLGKLGLMICMDQGRAELWARYAGKIDLMINCSCPPRMHDLTFIFPDGKRVRSKDFSPVMEHLYRSGDEIFGRYLRRQSAWLGVPVALAGPTGQFSSAIPLPHLSLAIYSLTRPDVWQYIPQAQAVRVESGCFNATYIADASGKVLAQAAPESESYVVAEVALADALPQPQGEQPAFGLPVSAYAFDDFANLALAPLYRQNVRRLHGERMAPVNRHTRLWTGALIAALALGYWLGRGARRR
jgi:predicted amidohydrolase